MKTTPALMGLLCSGTPAPSAAAASLHGTAVPFAGDVRADVLTGVAAAFGTALPGSPRGAPV